MRIFESVRFLGMTARYFGKVMLLNVISHLLLNHSKKFC